MNKPVFSAADIIGRAGTNTEHYAAHAVQSAMQPNSSKRPLSQQFTPTDEQRSIIDTVADGHNVIVQAGAGAAKTTTSCLVAEDQAQRGRSMFYTAFNKDIVRDVQNSYSELALSHTTVRTFHSLCFAVASAMPELEPLMAKFRRTNSSGRRESNADIANKRLPAVPPKFIYTPRAAHSADNTTAHKKQTRYYTPQRMVGFALSAIRTWCTTDAVQVEPEHVSVPEHISADPQQRKHFTTTVAELARDVWRFVICDPHNNVYFSHDYYLKLVALSDVDVFAVLGLPSDTLIFFDEAQDARPAMIQILLRAAYKPDTNYQFMVVGDSCQAIYASFTGARDALPIMKQELPNVKECHLTMTRRFGDQLAEIPNLILDILDAPLRLTTDPQCSSQLNQLRIDKAYSDFPERATYLAAGRKPRHDFSTTTLNTQPNTIKPTLDAVLVRTNSMNLAVCQELIAAGIPTASTINVRELRNVIIDTLAILRGDRNHRKATPALWDIYTKQDLLEMLDADDPTEIPTDLRDILPIIDQVLDGEAETILHTLDNLIEVTANTTTMPNHVLVTTIHKAKGKQWQRVLMAEPIHHIIPDYRQMHLGNIDAFLARISQSEQQRLDVRMHRRILEHTALKHHTNVNAISEQAQYGVVKEHMCAQADKKGMTLDEYRAYTRARLYTRIFGRSWIEDGPLTLSSTVREELMVAYVGLTRARQILHVDGNLYDALLDFTDWVKLAIQRGITDTAAAKIAQSHIRF